MSATINDVATLAGVSIKTVSRVLNGEPHVRPALRQRVMQAVEQLAYTPNQAARRLAGNRSFLIALLYNNPSPSYVAAIQEGAARRCRELGYHLIVEPLERERDNDPLPVSVMMKTLAPDGVILIPPLSDDAALLQQLARFETPVVRIAGYGDGPGSLLLTPEREAGRMAVAHFIAKGHKRIGIVAPPSLHQAADERLLGYKDALEAAGLPVDPDLIVRGRFDVESGQEAAIHLLALRRPPTAIFAANDEMAMGVMRIAREKQLQIPDDLSIVGFDDTPSSRSAWPPLTTVRQPLNELSAAAVDLIVLGESAENFDCRFTLVERATVSKPRAARR
ncbi:MAG: LacI family DNA-binding transcriptional regulator [Hyphomonadaceae bacterium]|nr:LacI family DNA-binding transcriptional regulator [Hyphomonadaceae bacterium]